MKEGGIVVLNFGSQYVQLIARRVRELNVYSEILPWDTPLEEIIKRKPKGIIFSGGPASVYAKDAPLPPEGIYELGIPILGICYGLQVMAHQLGGKVAPADKHEYGRATLRVLKEDKLFKGLPKEFQVWMSHADKVTELPPGFEVLAVSDNAPYAVIADQRRGFYGVQFHPEVTHSQYGTQIIANFVFEIAKAQKNWFMENFVEEQIEKIRQQVGDKKVIAALSGGVDSTVAAVLTYKAIGDNLIPIFIDHGLLREGEREEVERNLKGLGLPLRVVEIGRAHV